MPFIQTAHLRPIVRALNTPADHNRCSLAGWGVTAETNERAHPILMRVDLEIIPVSVCNGSQSFRGAIQPGMLCAGSMLGGRDACQVINFHYIIKIPSIIDQSTKQQRVTPAEVLYAVIKSLVWCLLVMVAAVAISRAPT